MSLLQRIANPFVTFVEKYYPDPFVFVILLTILTMALALGLTDTTAYGVIEAWGGGLSSLLTFMAQISLMLITAHALAHTDPASKLLRFLSRIPTSDWQAYAFVALISGLANLIAWSLGLVVGAIIARQVAIESDRRGLKLHFPLLVASAYAGFVIWHMGYSSSAALFVATEGHKLESIMGVIPVTATIFTSWNLAIALITLIGISIICPLLRPAAEDTISVKAHQLVDSLEDEEIEHDLDSGTFGDSLNHSKLAILVFGGLLAIYLFTWFQTKGLDLNLNIVNWTFLALGLLLSRSPIHYVELIKDASGLLGPILLQYPFYAGIMGLINGTGLVVIMSDWFTEIANSGTLTFWAFISSGIVNMFVPSGGGQWVVQGPIFIEAAKNLNVDPSLIVMSVAYGDQWTNMIQPFWTIPLLAIANLDMRKIMGYTFIIFLFTLLTFGGGLLILGAG
ncbi:MAG: TIGR00366 family protein [Bacteroidota bacterium]